MSEVAFVTTDIRLQDSSGVNESSSALGTLTNDFGKDLRTGRGCTTTTPRLGNARH